MSDRDHEPILRPPQPDKRTTGDVTRTNAGEMLPHELAGEMAAQFGADFGDVRVHHDAAADRAARRAGAQAFTRSNQITFAAGRFNPSSSTGRELLAHELAHVVQQRRRGSTADAEARADRAASAVIAGRSTNPTALGGSPLSVQTKPGDGPETDTTKQNEEAAASTAMKFSKVVDNFALDKDTLTAQHLKDIDDIAFSIGLHTGMLARGKARIEIVGHADTTGKDPHNEELGQKRADRVREALARKLTPREGEKPLTLDWSVRSAGETELLVPTADNTLEPRNRAVEIRVTIESIPAPKPPAPLPTLGPKQFDFTIHDEPVGPPKPPPDLWKKMEENQKKIEEFDKKHPRKPQSVQDVVVDFVAKAVDPIVDALPLSKDKKKWLRGKIRDGIEAGTEKACDAAVDASGASGQEADALKAACKAAIKMKEEKK